MKRVILESPWRGNIERNAAYARCCVKDCLDRGESPIASHLIFAQTGILREEISEERELGIKAGLAWVPVAEKMVVYADYGISDGMKNAMSRARLHNISIELREIGK